MEWGGTVATRSLHKLLMKQRDVDETRRLFYQELGTRDKARGENASREKWLSFSR